MRSEPAAVACGMTHCRSTFLAFVLFTASSVLAADLTDEVAAVEKIRGLKFSGPVEQKTITRADLRTYLIGQLEKELPLPVNEYLHVLDALELIDNDPDTLEKILALYQAQVLAFYDPPSNIYYSLTEAPKGVEMNEMMTRGVAIHELMHALQDQKFEAGDRLLRMKGNSDAQTAYQAVLEGEAMLVMMGSVLESLGQTIDVIVKNDAIRTALAAAANLNTGVPESVPPYFVESMKFPYLDGLAFVIEAYRRGGWDAVNALHKNPPVSSEEILHPELYFSRTAVSGRRPTRHPGPGTRDHLISETMGEFTWKFLLGEKPAAGWESDTVSVSKNGETMSVRIDSTWDTEADAAEFADAYEKFLSSRSLEPVVTRKKQQVSVSYITR